MIDIKQLIPTPITTLGIVTTGTWNASLITGTYGGTGINNGSSTITIAGNLVTTGAYNTTLAAQFTGITTLPSVATTLVGKTGTNTQYQISYWNDANQITSSSTLVYNPSATLSTNPILQVGSISQWQTISDLSPSWSFRNDLNDASFLTVENQSTGTAARSGLVVLGATQSSPAVNANYGLFGLFSKNYADTGLLDTLLISSGGDVTGGILIEADGGPVCITAGPVSVTGGNTTFNPTIYLPRETGVIGSGTVGINTSTIVSGATLSIGGSLSATSFANVSSYLTIPYVDNTGLFTYNSTFRWITGTNTIQLTSQASSDSTINYIPNFDQNGYLLSNTLLRWSTTDSTLRIVGQGSGLTGGPGSCNIAMFNGNNSLFGNTSLLSNWTDGSGIVYTLSAQATSGTFNWVNSWNSNSTASSAFLVGNYHNAVYGLLRTFNTGYVSSGGLDVAGATMLSNEGGVLNIVTGDNYPLKFGTNIFGSGSVGCANFSTAGKLYLGTAATSATYQLDVAGDIGIATLAKTLRLKSGSNGKIGTGTLSSGTATITNTSITSTSIIVLTDTGGGVLANLGALQVSSKTVGTGFTVTSSNALDTSTFTYIIFEQY